MIAAILAAFTALQPAPTVDTSQGDWILITVGRVVAPDQHPGECFVQAKIDQVVNGRNFRSGDAVAITLSCRPGGLSPVLAVFGNQAPTIETLRTQRRALVHLDAGGRVLDNGYYALEQALPLGPEP